MLLLIPEQIIVDLPCLPCVIFQNNNLHDASPASRIVAFFLIVPQEYLIRNPFSESRTMNAPVSGFAERKHPAFFRENDSSLGGLAILRKIGYNKTVKRTVTVMADTNREYKDRLFKFIFGNPQNTSWTLSLYNAINGPS